MVPKRRNMFKDKKQETTEIGTRPSGSKLSAVNKQTICKMILTSTWTYGIELRGSTEKMKYFSESRFSSQKSSVPLSMPPGFIKIYRQFFPQGDPTKFASLVFRVFDENNGSTPWGVIRWEEHSSLRMPRGHRPFGPLGGVDWEDTAFVSGFQWDFEAGGN
ncbi:hypothetical protein AAG570_012296 [Ranatra chinensis]|uniref:Uncharacterized protein n=1 Tax=Ranatra chinensis TaxID=642074 RepID=A0ABD0YKG9_9HEMI